MKYEIKATLVKSTHIIYFPAFIFVYMKIIYFSKRFTRSLSFLEKKILCPPVYHSDLRYGIHWPKLHNSRYAISVLYYFVMCLVLLLRR